LGGGNLRGIGTGTSGDVKGGGIGIGTPGGSARNRDPRKQGSCKEQGFQEDLQGIGIPGGSTRNRDPRRVFKE